MADPFYVASAKGGANANTFNLTIPASSQVDDILLLVRAGNTSSFSFIDLASPWAPAMTPVVSGSNTIQAWWRAVSSGVPGSTLASQMTGAAKHSAILMATRNVHLTNPIHDINVGSANNTTPGQTTPVLTTTEPAFIYEFWSERSSTPSTSSTLSGATKRQEQYLTGSAAVSLVGADDGFVGTPGSVGGDTLTWSSSASAFKFNLTVALLSEDGGVGGPTGGTLKRWDGTQFKTGGTLKRWDGTQFKTGGTLRRWDGTQFIPAP
jgi:hypothetical protein